MNSRHCSIRRAAEMNTLEIYIFGHLNRFLGRKVDGQIIDDDQAHWCSKRTFIVRIDVSLTMR